MEARMKCVICMENMKAENGGLTTNWSQRCITCVDSWICGSCYHAWDVLEMGRTQTCLNTMPCVICKKDMDYSYFVNRFDDGNSGGSGWWEYTLPHFSESLNKLLSRNVDN